MGIFDDEIVELTNLTRVLWKEGKSVGTIAIATTPGGPSFSATFETLPSFGDDPLEAEVERPGPEPVEYTGGVRAGGAVGECFWLTRVPGPVHVSCQWRRAVLFLQRTNEKLD